MAHLSTSCWGWLATTFVAVWGCEDRLRELEHQDSCSNTCVWAFDGVCGYATACADCGERAMP
ncbi:MAG: hypothetical protein ACOCZ8_02955 [Bacteroidota bacterium]